MNPYISANWFEIIFSAILVVIIGEQFWRRRPRPMDRLYTIGFLAFALGLAGTATSELFYHRALPARAWPTIGIFDQVIVTPTDGVFVKLKDPIIGRSDRVQRYNCRGDFEAAFQPANAGGVFKIALDQDSRISIYSVRTRTIDTFGFDGTFLRRREVKSSEMPFDFLKAGPSVMKAGGCEFIIDPVSGSAAVKDGEKVWPLERGDWVLEYLLGRRTIIAAALFGALMLLASFIKQRAEHRRWNPARSGGGRRSRQG